MRLFRNLGLVPKLAIVSGLSMLLMAAVIVLAILDVAAQKARTAADLQARTAIGVFEDALVRSNDALSRGTPGAERITATIWNDGPIDIPRSLLDQVSDVAYARLTFFAFDQRTGQFMRDATNVLNADGNPATGTPLDRSGPAYAALSTGRAFKGDTEILGSPFLTLYEPIVDGSGRVVGALAAAVPNESVAQTARDIVRGLAGWLVLSLAAGLSVTIIALYVLLRPLAQTTKVLTAMARKDFDVSLPRNVGNDEVGQVARAVADLRNDLAEGARLTAEAEARNAERERERLEQVRVVDELKAALSRLAEGDMTRRIENTAENPFPEAYEALRHSYNAVIDRVGGVLARVTAIAEGVRTSSQTITKASRDLSSRTETQAATLEESAAALNELTVSVRSTAERAAGAEEASKQNRSGAESGADVVGQAVTAMQGIEQSSEQITRIIGVIDDIAFQTNLLALNAGVEAARAGEAGRGFAVVASEVRLLAQRASDSAREIKELISESAAQVETGSSLVNKAGTALSDILERAQRAASFVEEIASAASEQANGLKEINTGINQLDHVTQQNRAVSEETTASASDLLAQADDLIAALSEFQVEAGVAGRAAAEAPRQSAANAIDVTPRVADWKAAADAAANSPRAQAQTGPAGTASAAKAPVPDASAKGGSAWHEF